MMLVDLNFTLQKELAVVTVAQAYLGQPSCLHSHFLWRRLQCQQSQVRQHMQQACNRRQFSYLLTYSTINSLVSLDTANLE